MTKYIVNDLTQVLGYLPYGLASGIVACGIILAINATRQKSGRGRISVPGGTLFFVYIVIMLFITFLSRESGSRVGVDLELFSTWGINQRNNAFVMENIMLFVPYGFLGACTLLSSRNLFSCMVLGMFTSLEIEYMQLVTQRGYFQIDDILTNTLGAVMGYLLFRMLFFKKKPVGREEKIAGMFQVFEIPAVLFMIAVMLYLIAITGICPTDVSGWFKPSDRFA